MLDEEPPAATTAAGPSITLGPPGLEPGTNRL